MTGSHATYNAGPGKTYATLTAVPWLSLAPGDVVNIFYQATPYATKIGIQAVGTAAQPIVINGVTDANCNRPIITGENAVDSTDSLAANFWAASAPTTVEPLGAIIFIWGPTQAYATSQSYITIQNIEVTGATSANTFTNHSGQQVNYAPGNGIYGVAVNHVTIQYDTVTGNDQGVFFNSQDTARTSQYVTLRGNDIYGNGIANQDELHNIYVQGVRSLYEGNYIGSELSGAQGSSLKDRSSGPVIRNNYIVATARAIDMVDSEESPTVLDDPLYDNGWVYGNVIVNNCAVGICSGDLIHWGGDSGTTANYHNGPLFFYYNTVIVENAPASSGFQFGIFDMPTSQQSVDVADNIIAFLSNGAGNTMGLGICCGTINLIDANWITSGYATGASGNTITLNKPGTVLTGANPLLNADFTLSATSGSPVLGQATLYPTSVPNAPADVTTLQPTDEYANTVIGVVPRPNDNDLGAYAAH